MTLQVSRVLVFILGIPAASGLAQVPRASLRPVRVASKQLTQLANRSLLPAGNTALLIDPKQSFDLIADGKKQMTILSASFRVPDGATSPLYCGVFLRSADGTQTFFNPVSSELPIVCEGITAVRLRRDPGVPPAFVFTGRFTSGARAFDQRFVISWDKAAGKYTLDDPGF